MCVFYSPKFLQHSLGKNHPEDPKRLEVILEGLNKLGYKTIEPKDINEKELFLVHDEKYIERIKDLCKKNVTILDNIFPKDTFLIAKLAAAAAKEAALNCFKEFSLALVRPPGHHAGRNFFGGFCYLNNIAFAVKYLQISERIEKAMIIDFDYHFGNGTWNIFYNDPSVFYLSFHCDPRVAYPGTGFESENTEHMKNVVFPQSTNDKEYIKKFEETVKTVYQDFDPELIAVSAGFDTYHKDPIAGLEIKDTNTYKKIGKIIFSIGKPTFAVLEGGYCIEELGILVRNFISAFE